MTKRELLKKLESFDDNSEWDWEIVSTKDEIQNYRFTIGRKLTGQFWDDLDNYLFEKTGKRRSSKQKTPDFIKEVLDEYFIERADLMQRLENLKKLTSRIEDSLKNKYHGND